jgi:predicted RNA-binding protein YlxR (DUF448 family)
LTASSSRPELTHAAASRAAASRRRCALTREEHDTTDLIRFVLGPGGAVAPDVAGKLGGRGVWISATRTAVDEAARRNVFAKSLKSKTIPPADLGALVDRLLHERLRQALSFAAKAGLLVAGYTKVDEALDLGRVVVLIQANDAADDGAKRLAGKYLAVRRADGAETHVLRTFTSAELSMALGRTNVVHAALAGGGQTSALLRESLRLERFRRNDGTRSASLSDTRSGSAGGLETGNE